MNGSSPIIGVYIEIRLNEVLINNVTEDASRTTSILTSLMPLTTYSLTIYVVSTVGRSLPSTINSSTSSLSEPYSFNKKKKII